MLALVGPIALTLGVATLPNGAPRCAARLHTRSPLPLCWTRPDRLGRADGRGSCRKQTLPSKKPWCRCHLDTPGARLFCTGRYSGASHPAVQESPEQRAGRFKRKCAAVADTFCLSRKETEVLFLLAKGRTRRHPGGFYISSGHGQHPHASHLPQAGRPLPARAHRSGGIHGGGLALVDLVGFHHGLGFVPDGVGVSCCTARGRMT